MNHSVFGQTKVLRLVAGVQEAPCLEQFFSGLKIEDTKITFSLTVATLTSDCYSTVTDLGFVHKSIVLAEVELLKEVSRAQFISFDNAVGPVPLVPIEAHGVSIKPDESHRFPSCFSPDFDLFTEKTDRCESIVETDVKITGLVNADPVPIVD